MSLLPSQNDCESSETRTKQHYLYPSFYSHVLHKFSMSICWWVDDYSLCDHALLLFLGERNQFYLRKENLFVHQESRAGSLSTLIYYYSQNSQHGAECVRGNIKLSE